VLCVITDRHATGGRPLASIIAAALRVVADAAATSATSGSVSGTSTSVLVMPAATMRLSATIGAPAATASHPWRNAASSSTRSSR
jgi:hypothetical protein